MSSLNRQNGPDQVYSRVREAVGLVADVLGVITGLGAVGGVLIAGVALLISNLSSSADLVLVGQSVALSASSISVGALISAVVMSRRLRRYIRGYEWVSAEYVYKIDPVDPTLHIATTKIEIRALRDDVRVFENRYSWSGTGLQGDPTVSGPGRQILLPMSWDGSFRHYFVSFNPPLVRREIATIEIRQEFRDTAGDFQKYYAKTVVEPLRRLSLKVVLLSGLPSVTVTHTERSSNGGGRVINRCAGSYDGSTGEIFWEVRGRPKRGHNYRIDWQ